MIHNGKEVVGSNGMTMREWYAGMALQGLLAAFSGDHSLPEDERAARMAFGYADAMLKMAKEAP